MDTASLKAGGDDAMKPVAHQLPNADLVGCVSGAIVLRHLLLPGRVGRVSIEAVHCRNCLAVFLTQGKELL